MQLEDLFPFCYNVPCAIEKKVTGPHKHVLPAQRELITAPEKLILSAGGYGSGKSVAAAILVHLLLSAIPGNRAFIGRVSYPKQHETAQRTYMEVLERSGVDYEGRERRDGWAHWIIYPNGSEAFFRETKDIGRFLGSEYGVFWLDEVIEMPKTVLTGLLGRLRLPVAHQQLKGILTTNPPGRLHWVTQLFGEEPGVKTISSIEGTSLGLKVRRIGSASWDNPALPQDYVDTLRATLSESETKRVLSGKTTFVHEGKPVFVPPFSFDKHVGVPEPTRGSDTLILPMVRGWDFGYHAPAVTWHQITRCWERRLHWIVYDEFTPQDIEAEDLAREVLEKSKRVYPHVSGWIDIGDAQGAAMSDKGPGPIVRLGRPPFNLRFRYKKFPNIDPGLDLIRVLLRQGVCKCGRPTMYFHRRCQTTIEAFEGGYHYPKVPYGREERTKPVKDGWYDNSADSVRYVGELGYRPAAVDQGMLDRLTTFAHPRTKWAMPGSRGEPLVTFPYPDPMRKTDERAVEIAGIDGYGPQVRR